MQDHQKNFRREQWKMLLAAMFCYLFFYTGRHNFGWAAHAMADDLQRTMPDAQIFINDRVDVALALGSRGVHLRESSLPTAVARSLLRAEQLLGQSVHSVEAAIAAEREGADFVVLGPIYETPSKQEYGPPLGLGALEKA